MSTDTTMGGTDEPTLRKNDLTATISGGDEPTLRKNLLEIDPVDDIPVPYDTADEFDQLGSKLEQLAVTGRTAEMKEMLGAELFVGDDKAALEHKELLDDYLKEDKKPKTTLKSTGVQLAATGFIKTYGQMLGHVVEEERASIKNKLFEIANCGDPRYELKALELLGKTSDIALFTERSEINIKHTTSEGLENEIKERVKRLLNQNTIDITPMDVRSLDDELGVFEENEDKIEEDKNEPVTTDIDVGVEENEGE